jgi:hypothetical protein
MNDSKRTASWHCHHETLCEWDSEPRETRIAYIRSDKPACEHELRLRLYQPMSAKGVKLLAEYEKVKQAAWAEYEKVEQPAWAEYKKVEQAALAEYKKVKQAALAALEALHEIECPNCPWNGLSIFP